MLDLMNPIGMFKDGKRLQEYSSKNYLPMSGKLIPEFDRRRNIKDMFTRKPSMVTSKSSFADEPSQWPSTAGLVEEGTSAEVPAMMEPVPPPSAVPVAASPPVKSAPVKRQKSVTNAPAAKRPKSGLATPLNGTGKGQQSLKGFFKPKSTPSAGLDGTEENAQGISIGSGPVAVISQGNGTLLEKSIGLDEEAVLDEPEQSLGEVVSPTRSKASEDLVDPIVSKESWGKLFTKPIAPKCEHEEPCKTMLTKKKGANCGRSFWMCARPLGPSGQKERGTQWRCSTFIWCSDWNGSTGGG